MMMRPSTNTPTRLSTYDTTMFTRPDTKGTRTDTPNALNPMSDKPMNPHTAGMAARIMAYWVYRVATSVVSESMTTQVSLGCKRMLLTRSIRFMVPSRQCDGPVRNGMQAKRCGR
ncbi:hypothetical protein D3C87_1728840 [compost metagenome]